MAIPEKQKQLKKISLFSEHLDQEWLEPRLFFFPKYVLSACGDYAKIIVPNFGLNNIP